MKRVTVFLVLFLFLLSLVLSGCGKLAQLAGLAGELESDTSAGMYAETKESDVVGDVVFPPESQRAGWKFADKGDIATLTAYYEDITLKQVVDFLDGLSADGWYLTGHYAYLGARNADFEYSLDTRSLNVAFTLVKGSPAWPEGTLTPYLQYLTSPYPYGTYMGCEADASGKAFTLTYKDTNYVELMHYLDTLQAMGYTTDDGKTLRGDINYVSYVYNYETETAAITVGQRDIALVPLPPWPEPMPEHVSRLLPPVWAGVQVTGADDGFFAKAEQLSLAELYDFVKGLAEYGWSEPSDQEEMEHADSGFALRFLSYDTVSSIMTLTIWNREGGILDTGGIELPDTSVSPSVELQEALGEDSEPYRYVLTQGSYGETQVNTGIKSEFGEEARLADFAEIKSLSASDFPAFLDGVGVQVGEDVWVQYFGDEYFGDQRHYFLARVSGREREGFMIQDQVGDEAWLGSWYGMQLRAMGKVPG